jgi:predicted nucleic acid-binding protein
MAGSVVVDAGFLIALLSRRDTHNAWAVAEASNWRLPWSTCDAVLSEAFHLLGAHGRSSLAALLRRGAVVPTFNLDGELDRVLTLMQKYASVPMSIADACLVRMTETLSDPIILSTDRDFHVYRRHSRHVVPCRTPY